MARNVEKSEDQKTWEVMSQFWRSYSYNRHGQMSNGHQHKQRHREEAKDYTVELEQLAERDLVAFNNDTQHWEWTKVGADWCTTFLSGLKSEN